MTAEWWILLAGQIITLLGLGGVLVWMGRTIKAMKGTVDAQKETITAQATRMGMFEGLVKTMETVLQTIDVPKMAEKYKAYKDIMDHEKEALVERFQGEIDRLQRGAAADYEMMVDSVADGIGCLFDVGMAFLPYVPKSQQVDVLDSIEWKPPYDVVRLALRHAAQAAPDLTPATTYSMWLGSVGAAKLSEILGPSKDTPPGGPSSISPTAPDS